jgi:hypothetical protein
VTLPPDLSPTSVVSGDRLWVIGSSRTSCRVGVLDPGAAAITDVTTIPIPTSPALDQNACAGVAVGSTLVLVAVGADTIVAYSVS